MSRRPARIKLINLEDGMPTVEQARLRMQYELRAARQAGFPAAKLVHGYGSSGAGGALRGELQKELRKAVEEKAIQAFIPGEDWRVSDAATWDLLKRFPEWKKDCDLGRKNQGISIVIL
jgi:DNA-nicking Smr family endonuclease